MITVKPIHNDADLSQALERIGELWGAVVGTPEGDELDILAMLVERYEDVHFPMPPSDPVAAIKFMMEQKGLTQKDLVQYLGSPSKTSEVLNRKRPLSINMVKRLHQGLGIPYGCLLA